MAVDPDLGVEPSRIVPAAPAPRGGGVAAAIGLSILTFIVGLLSTRQVIGLNADSATYLSTAWNLFHGHGLTDFTHHELVQFGPLYPTLLGFVELFGAGAEQTARFLNALLWGASVFLTYLLAKRYVRGEWLAVLATLLVACRSAMAEVSGMVWSEPLFIVLVLASLLLVERALVSNERWSAYIVAGIALGVASLERYVGLAISFAAIFVIAITLRNRSKGWLRSSALTALPALGLPILWMVRNQLVAGSATGRGHASIETVSAFISQVSSEIGQFVVPLAYNPRDQLVPTASIVVQIIGFALICAALAWFVIATQRTMTRRANSWSKPLLVLASTASYLAVFLVTELTSPMDPFNTRFSSPLVPFFAVLTAVAIDRARSAKVGHQAWFRVASFGGVALLILVVAQFTLNALDFSVNPYAQFGQPYWTNSETSAAVGRLPSSTPVYTNVPYGLWLAHQGRDIRPLPIKAAWRTSEHFAFPVHWAPTTSCQSVYVAWFVNAPDFYYAPTYLEQIVKLTKVANLKDGVIYSSTAFRCP